MKGEKQNVKQAAMEDKVGPGHKMKDKVQLSEESALVKAP